MNCQSFAVMQNDSKAAERTYSITRLLIALRSPGTLAGMPSTGSVPGSSRPPRLRWLSARRRCSSTSSRGRKPLRNRWPSCRKRATRVSNGSAGSEGRSQPMRLGVVSSTLPSAVSVGRARLEGGSGVSMIDRYSPVRVLEQLLDVGRDIGGLELVAEALHRLAVAADQEFREIPFDLAV